MCYLINYIEDELNMDIMVHRVHCTRNDRMNLSPSKYFCRLV